VPTTDLPVHAVDPLLRWFNARMGDALAPALATQYGRGDGGRVRVAVHDAFIVKYHHDEPAPSDGDGDGDRDDGEEEGAEAFEMACVRHFPALFPRPAAAGGTGGTVATGAAPPRGPSQRHLPLHTDQSTHSLTIALNAFATTTTTATINDAAPAPPPAAAPLLPLLPERYRGGGTYVAAWGCAVRPPAGHVLSFPGSLLHGGDPLLGGTRCAPGRRAPLPPRSLTSTTPLRTHAHSQVHHRGVPAAGAAGGGAGRRGRGGGRRTDRAPPAGAPAPQQQQRGRGERRGPRREAATAG
jgi:hypothetical protein